MSARKRQRDVMCLSATRLIYSSTQELQISLTIRNRTNTAAKMAVLSMMIPLTNRRHSETVCKHELHTA